MRRLRLIAGIILISIMCFACTTNGNGTVSGASSDTGFVAAVAGNYDSADTAVLISRDTEAMTMTLLNLELGRQYTLNYDGATTYADKYGQAMSLEQLTDGDVVNVTFMKDRKRLNSLQLASDAFMMPAVENFTVADNGRSMVINGTEYSVSKDLVVLSDSGVGELMDINSVDVLRVSGQDHTIESINIVKGHGYLRLINDAYFVGGWIEVNQSLICPIEADMLLAVPEGSYPVTVSNSGSAGTATITVARNEEYELDVSQWQGETKYGYILFTVTPDSAHIYIDGEVVDLSEQVELTYGIHQMVVIADGYTTISKYIKVGSEMSNMNITMERDIQASASANASVSTNATVSENVTVSGDSVSGNVSGNTTPSATPTATSSATATATASASVAPSTAPSTVPSATASATPSVAGTSYQVSITAPEGVEVYKDGSYVGIAPVSFTKTEGAYVITLRKDGYQTRSYTITVDNTNKDVSYSFSTLLPIP